MNPDTSDDTSAVQSGRRVTIMGRKFRVPDSPHLRLGIGSLFIIGGILGFLPVLGFWMIPLGLVILSVDMPAVRRVRRRSEVWLGRKTNGIRGNGKANGKTQKPASPGD